MNTDRSRTIVARAPAPREVDEVLAMREKRREELEDTIDDVVSKCDAITGDHGSISGDADLGDEEDTLETLKTLAAAFAGERRAG